MLFSGRLVTIDLINPTPIVNDYTKVSVVSGEFISRSDGLVTVRLAAYMNAEFPYISIPDSNISGIRVMYAPEDLKDMNIG